MINKTVFIEEISAQVADVKAEINKTLASVSLSKNTIHTKSYNLRRELKFLTVIESLLRVVSNESLDKELRTNSRFSEYFTSIMNPSNGGSRIVVKAGDTLLGIIQANKGAKDVVNRAMKSADAAGLTLDKDGNTFISH